VDDSARHAGRRTLTPAVLAAALFTVACAALAVTFVAARGGLQLPVAPGSSQAAVATAAPSSAPTVLAPTSAPSTGTPITTPVPSAPSTRPSPTPGATDEPLPTPESTPDPLAALPGCPGIEGCYEYTVVRGDTLSGVASRYGIPLSTVRALNPELDTADTIVVGQVIYLGRAPQLRLDPCGDADQCYLYVVQPGDGLSTIAARFGLTVEAILDANPQIPNANTIYSGQVIRLQYQHGVI
jgi:nucleoid-associated protein YgaU